MIGRLIRRWRDWRETRRAWRWDELFLCAALLACAALTIAITVDMVWGLGDECLPPPGWPGGAGDAP